LVPIVSWKDPRAAHAAQRTIADVDTLIRWFGLEERVYRMRCVEAIVDRRSNALQ